MTDASLDDRHSRVLVTGGAGFVGGHLVDALVEDAEVVVLDDLSAGSRDRVHSAATLIEGDIRDRETVESAMAGADVVFHLAGMVSVSASTADPVASQSANVDGTVTVLDVARQTDTRVVAASSAAVYGHPETVPISEDADLSPTSPYGVDKLALDHYTRLFADLYDLPTVALRYFNIYGPGQPEDGYSGVVNTFLEQAESGAPLTVHGDGSQVRDFVHVSDVVRANLLAANTDHTGRAFNVGTGRRTSVADLAETVKEVVDDDPSVTHVGSRPGDIEESVADLTNVRERLGYEPRVTLADGLSTLVD
jgi:UDP-glucose 4-epimerase